MQTSTCRREVVPWHTTDAKNFCRNEFSLPAGVLGGGWTLIAAIIRKDSTNVFK